jgi:DNA topoisomerase VI subunit B
VTVNPRANVYTLGTVVTLTATPDAGQSFLGWAGDASGTTSPLSITMDQSKIITASFSRKPVLTAKAAVGSLTDQGFGLTLDGELGGAYRIDSSTSLVDWLPLMTVTNPYGRVQFVDPSDTSVPRRFYRAVQLP